MEIQELSQQKMKVMQEIAQGNLLLSGMKADYQKLLDEKDKFFEDRQKGMIDKVKEILKESQSLLDETSSNYEKVHQFSESLTLFAKTVSETYSDLKELIQDFNEKSQTEREEIKRQQEEVNKLKINLKLSQEEHARDKKFFTEKKKELDKIKEKIASERAVLGIAYKIMKDQNGK